MASTIQIRVDDELKLKSDNLFRDLGTDTTTAIRIFLTQAVANNGFPFEIKKTDFDTCHCPSFFNNESLFLIILKQKQFFYSRSEYLCNIHC